MAEPMTNGPRASKPNPDPTIATHEAVERAMKSERDYVDGKIELLMERFRGIDTATRLLSETASQVPAHIDEKVACFRDVVEERFASVSGQFAERDTRSERESRDNKVAVDAAFAAQKEAAAKQDEANAKAIDKSEKATAETIKTNQELSRSTTDALTKSLDEVKLQVAATTAARTGGLEQRQESRQSLAGVYGLVGAVGTGIGIVGVLAAVGAFG